MPRKVDAVKGTTIWPAVADVAVPIVGALGGAVTTVVADGAEHTSPGVTPLFDTEKRVERKS